MTNVQNLVRVRPKESYSREALNEIHLISFTEDGAIPFGSSVYVIQKYPGDIDTYEHIIEKGPEEKVIRSFAKQMKKKVFEIFSSDCHVVSDIKAGIDKEFDLSIGDLYMGSWTVNWKNLKTLMSRMDSNDVERITQILKIPYTATEYDEINKIVREYKIIRWTAKQLIKGSQIKNGKKITLEQALHGNSQVKIDSVSIIDGKFVETTNMLYIGFIGEDGKVVAINTSYDFLNPTAILTHYEESLRAEIEKLFYSSIWYSPFKGAKRMWAFSRVFYEKKHEYGEYLVKLTPLISGNISLLYQIRSEIETILLALSVDESFSSCVADLLPERIDEWRVSISHVVELNDTEMKNLLGLVDLQTLSDALKKVINRLTIQDLKNLNLYPIPRSFLPEKPSYYH